MPRVALLFPLVALPLVLSACEIDESSPNDDDIGDADGDDSSADTDDQQANWVPARGIGIVEVEANQGTRVPIGGPEGAWVDGSGRNTFLTGERDTLIRVHWDVAEGWVPKDVEARLTIEIPGVAEPVVLKQTVLVEDDSTPTALSRTFYFGLIAAEGHTVPGTQYQIELFEKDTDQQADLPELARVTPASGPELIGFETAPMEIRIRLVPIHYTGEGKDLRPDLSDENVAILINALYEQNPVQEIIYDIRGEVGYGQTMQNLGALLPLMAQAKQSDGAPANVYYHAIANIGCPVVGCGNAGVAGIAQLAGDTKSDSLMRVGATVFHNVAASADTFVHEVGHNQGFQHVACPNADAAGPDPTYPYDDGKIGNWGFGIRAFDLHNPTASHDYMTYCGNTWASDWTFNKAFIRIRTLTAWDYEDQGQGDAGVPSQDLLVGALYPDGSEEWFTIQGGVLPEQLRAGEALEFGMGGQVVQQPAVVRTLSDDQTQWVYAPVPEGFDVRDLDSLAHLRDGMRRDVDPAVIKVPVAGTDILAPN